MKIAQEHSEQKRWHLLWMFFLFPLMLLGQSKPQLKSILTSELSAIEKREQALNFLINEEKKENDSIHFLYSDYARWARKTNKKEAINFGKKALEHAYKQQPQDTAFIERAYVGLAFSLQRDQQFKEAIGYYKKVTQLNRTAFFKTSAYEQLGYLSYLLQDYHRSIEYYETAIDLLKGNPQRQHQLRNCYLTIHNNHIKIGKKEDIAVAEKYVLRADSLAQQIPTDAYSLYAIKYGLAQINNRHENLNIETSMMYYDEALEIAKMLQDSTKISSCFYGKGSLLNTTNQPKSAAFYNLGLNYTSKIDTLNLHLLYSGLGTTYAYSEEFEKSILYHHKGLKALTNQDFHSKNDSLKNYLIKAPRKFYLLKAIPNLAESYLRQYEVTQKIELLEQSIRYFELADYLIDLLKLNGSDFKSRLFWRELSTEIYGKAIKSCYLLDNHAKAFYFMEKNKALLLMEDLAKQNFKRSLNLPQEILERELALKKQILQKEHFLNHDSKLSLKERTLHKEALINDRIHLKNLVDSITSTKTNLKLEPSILELTKVQQTLKPDELIVEFSISEDDGFGIYSNNNNGYALFIASEKIRLIEITDLSHLKDELVLLINSLKKPFKTAEDIDNYAALSHKVFDKLFPSQEIKQSLIGKKITLIPDGPLSLIPFEALSTTSKNINYLIRDCEIKYLYSNSFLKNLSLSKNSEARSLGIAPISFENQDLLTLRNSETEVDQLQTYYKGDSFLKGEASKASFIKNVESYDILHLATHADAQDQSAPWIAFHDEKITLDELYLVPNNASLVVLSGCNTTLGKQAAGEGVMSLARGFFYSGAHSVISSLWSIDDASSAKIIGSFYKNLSQGTSKSEALHMAKIDYLDTHTHSESSPYYWASFILLGEDDAIPSPSHPWKFYLFGFIVLLVMALLYQNFRKRKKLKIRG